jgi:hypothetical protein
MRLVDEGKSIIPEWIEPAVLRSIVHGLHEGLQVRLLAGLEECIQIIDARPPALS